MNYPFPKQSRLEPIFVGQVPKSLTHLDLCVIFGRFGDLDEVFVIRDPKTNNSKGCCFVIYSSMEAAQRCIEGQFFFFFCFFK